MSTSPLKVVVTGAAGQIGYALLFRIASGQMFGPDTEIELHLLEVAPAIPVLEGVVMELEDGAFPLLKRIFYTHEPLKAMKDADWVILVGAAPRKAGMERSDLLKINGSIFAAQGQALNAVANRDVKVFVVGNPCNSNALIAMHHAPNIPKRNFYAMTLLDQHRAVSLLAKKLEVPHSEIRKLAIWGNHSATQYPDFYQATIGTQAITEIAKEKKVDLDQLVDQLIPQVQQRGAAVIQARGASSAASAAHAALRSIYCLTHDTPKDDWFSVALCSQGEYGVDEGLIFSYPCQMRQGKLHIIEGLQHNSTALARINTTLEELRQEYRDLQALGLI